MWFFILNETLLPRVTTSFVMDDEEPLPLLEKLNNIHHLNQFSDDEENSSRLLPSHYGYVIIGVSWVIFVSTINSLFRIWSYVICPLAHSENTKTIYEKLYSFFEISDSYVLKLWSIYIVIWWWSVVSWIGLKLFRHSKGIQED